MTKLKNIKKNNNKCYLTLKSATSKFKKLIYQF